MGSKRFPGKMLRNLGELTLIEWIVYRLKKVKNNHKIILATTKREEDYIFRKIAKKWDIDIYCGSENDVLKRYFKAAISFNIDIIIRVCGDNPFTAPEEIDRLIIKFKKSNYDYMSNRWDENNSNYPNGFGGEILFRKVLEYLNRTVNDKYLREHVTLALFKKNHNFLMNSISAPINISYPELRFDVDIIKDLKYLKKLVMEGVSLDSSAEKIVSISHKIDQKINV